MRTSPTNRDEIDEIDAVLGDDIVDADLSLLAAVVHDIRSEYRMPEPLHRSEELLAFTGAVSVPATAASPSAEPIPLGRQVRRRGLQAAGLGLANKVLLGTTLAAASVGGLGAAGVVELPGLPEQAADQAVEMRPAVAPPDSIPTDDDADTADAEASDADETAEAAGPPADVPGAAVSEAAQMKRGFAAEFVASMVEWAACAEGLPAAEKESACGTRPHPSDFGVTDPPGQLAAAQNRPAHAGPPADAGPPDELPTTASDNAPATPGNGTGGGPG